MVMPQAQVELGLSSISALKQQITSRQEQLAALGNRQHGPKSSGRSAQIADRQSQRTTHPPAGAERGGQGPLLHPRKLPSLTLEIERKQREVKFHETLFDLLSKQNENASVEESYAAPIELVDAAVLPDEKSWPSRRLFFLGGFLAGAVLAMVYACCAAMMSSQKSGDAFGSLCPTIIQYDGRTVPLGRWRQYVLVLAACTLSCTVVLKIGQIQYLEVIFAADLLLLATLLIWNGLKLRVLPPFLQIAQSYATFLLAAFVLSLFALQQDFPLQTGGLKSPVLVTVARMVELSLDAFYMLYLAFIFREDERLCRFGINTYFWTGIAGCLYSFATLPVEHPVPNTTGHLLNDSQIPAASITKAGGLRPLPPQRHGPRRVYAAIVDG